MKCNLPKKNQQELLIKLQIAVMINKIYGYSNPPDSIEE
jgi:hypothetical protein